MRRHARSLLLAVLLALVAGLYVYLYQHGLTGRHAIRALYGFLGRAGAWGPVIVLLVEEKLRAAGELYQFLMGEFHQGRAFVLELMVVVILIIDLVTKDSSDEDVMELLESKAFNSNTMLAAIYSRMEKERVQN
jgi:hypothetical protein